MITNATLISVSQLSGADRFGQITYAAAVSSGGRCLVDEVTMSARWSLGTVIKDATHTIYVEAKSLPAGTKIHQQSKLLTRLDADTADRTWVVEHVVEYSGGLEHFKAFVRETA